MNSVSDEVYFQILSQIVQTDLDYEDIAAQFGVSVRLVEDIAINAVDPLVNESDSYVADNDYFDDFG